MQQYNNLVGGGKEVQALRARIDSLGLQDHVILVGRVPHADVARYYSLVDLLVFPRKSMRLTETVTPLKPLEAMAQGKIVLASDVGGHRELIRDNQTGWLFAPDDPAALATAVLKANAMRSQWPAIRATARRFVETERTWRASAAHYVPLYARLAPAHFRT